MVMPTARDASVVLLDTSPIVSFSEDGALRQLSLYLGRRAAIALDVHRELTRLSRARFRSLRRLQDLGWPSGEPQALPPYLLADAVQLQRLEVQHSTLRPGHAGEIATALLAGQLRSRGVLVIMDDRLGRRLLRFRGIAFLTSVQLALEMASQDALDEREARAVYAQASPEELDRFEQRLASARASVGSARRP